MLITPKLYSEEQSNLMARLMKMHGIETYEERYEVIAPGVIYAHLNFNHDLKKFQKIEEYPNFGNFPEWELRLATSNLAQQPENEWARKRLDEVIAELARHPKEDLFIKDGWNHLIDKHNAEHEGIADVPEFDYYLNAYGVCDTVEQLLGMYDFERDPRALVIKVTPMLKKDQSEDGGWRWHKWGPYIGTHTPTCEYLYDEPDIDGVLCYHIYEIVDETDEEMYDRESHLARYFDRIRHDVEEHEAKTI